MAHAVFFTWVNRALDAEGVPISGAKLSFFESGTTTPVTIYSDIGLTTPHDPQTIVSDANGIFPPVYVAASEPLRVSLTYPDDTDVEGYPVDHVVPFLADDIGAFMETAATVPNADGDVLSVSGVYNFTTSPEVTTRPTSSTVTVGAGAVAHFQRTADRWGEIFFECGDGAGRNVFVRNRTGGGVGNWGRLFESEMPSFVYGLVTDDDAGHEDAGILFAQDGFVGITRANDFLLRLNRLGDDGKLVGFEQANTEEGNISVSTTTVAYNTFMGAHWSQLVTGDNPEILRGTIVESLDELCGWPGETNDRLPRFKISDTAASKAVYGVFHRWDEDGDAEIASLGAYFVRVRAGETVLRGDLIESAGDGTGRVQADDVVRSSTVAKVTSAQVAVTYPDGSYLVPATLHCG